MTEMKGVFVPPNEGQLKNIRAELNEDVEKLDHYVELIKEWAKSHEYIPKECDEFLLRNYIRLCKYNLPKIKEKIEISVHLAARYPIFHDIGPIERFFAPYAYHRSFVPLPKQTPEGYRVFVTRSIDPDPSNFDMVTALRYACVHGNYTAHEDVNAGAVGVVDCTNVGVSYLGKFDFGAFKEAIDVANVLPARIRAVHVVGLPSFAEGLFAVGRSLAREKIRGRIVLHADAAGLAEYIPRDVLPVDLGGDERSLDEIADEWRRHLSENVGFREKCARLKPAATPPPKSRANFTQDYLEGSFRKLTID